MCLLIVFSISTVVMGQSESSSRRNFPRHELSFGYGDVLLVFSPADGAEPVSGYPNYDWFSSDTYLGDEKSPGAFSLSYMYGLKKWLWLGAYTTYTPFFQNVYDFSHQKIGTNYAQRISVIPMIRFIYVNKEYLNLYSAFGIGFSFGLYNNVDKGITNYSSYPVIQLTGIGISVGKQLRGFAELGCGPRGVFHCGVQYRFGGK